MVYSKLKNKLKHHFHEVIKIKTTPHEIALGFSVGTFIGILPTPGFGILLAVLIFLIYEKISKLSLIGALAFWNPIVMMPIYFLSYKIGDWFFGSQPIIKY